LYFEDKVLAMLEKYNYPTKGEAAKNSRVVIQSFESSALRRFRKATGTLLLGCKATKGLFRLFSGYLQMD
jgi:glycerophosphoryl diester phosphodiesterase